MLNLKDICYYSLLLFIIMYLIKLYINIFYYHV